MQVKTFRGKDTKAVMHQIRSELGPDAVILSTQTIKNNGHSYCEAMAAMETPKGNGNKGKNADSNPPGWNAWHREWSKIKEHLFSLITPQINLEQVTPRQRLILEYLEREGVNPETLVAIWEKFKNNPNASSLSLLTSLVKTKPLGGRNWPQKFHAFAGPHGVGKTSLTLRLALKAKQGKKNRICLANADVSQGKGRIFLRHYAELSGFDYRELSMVRDWMELLQESDQFDKIFIDLPAMKRDQRLNSWLETSGACILEKMRIHLCLSPVYGPDQLMIFRKKYASARLASSIWTKLDEACNYGSLVDGGISMKLPISGLSYGPGLKDSIAPAKDHLLWKVILKHKLPDETTT